jgi:hypothetical protein
MSQPVLVTTAIRVLARRSDVIDSALHEQNARAASIAAPESARIATASQELGVSVATLGPTVKTTTALAMLHSLGIGLSYSRLSQ